MKKPIIAIFLLAYFISCSRQQSITLKNQDHKAPLCPSSSKKVFLPRSFPATEIFLGFSSDPPHLSFIETLINASKKNAIKAKINVVIPSSENIEAHEYFRNQFAESINLRLIPTHAKETIWIQDYFEILTDTSNGQYSILDLPYFDREEETTPYDIALNLKRGIVSQVEFDDKDAQPGNGDYGGNIEALSTKILAVGNNMTSKLKEKLASLTDQEVLELDVSWLETGHIDEIINLLPDNNKGDNCQQTLMVVSPGLGIQLLKSAEYQNVFSKEELYFESYNNGDEQWPNYTPCLKVDMRNNATCKQFFQSNLAYQQIITKSILKIQDAFQKHHHCKLDILNIPTLFAIKNSKERYGTAEDRAVAFNQNSVNNIFFWPTLIIPRQSISIFQKYIEKRLSAFDLDIIFANGDHVHQLSGGIHCATNIVHSCRP